MELTPDNIVLWDLGSVQLNATIVYTWAVMAIMVLGSFLLTRRLSTGPVISRRQNLLEAIVGTIRSQIQEVSRDQPDRYMAFIGTLFLFIAVSNILGIVPGFTPPTGSLSTAAALAVCVFVAVPVFGIAQEGAGRYFRRYLQPSPFMLPFHIIGELSRTLALAVRLFGNVMSGTLIVGLLLAIAPLFFPIIMQILGLLTGMIQAYIFAILALVYIASGTEAHRGGKQSHGIVTQDSTS